MTEKILIARGSLSPTKEVTGCQAGHKTQEAERPWFCGAEPTAQMPANRGVAKRGRTGSGQGIK